MIVSAISFIGFAASIAALVTSVRRLAANAPARRSRIAWSIVFALIQAALGVWAALGFVQPDIASALVVNVVLSGCAWASAHNAELYGRAERSVQAHPVVSVVVLLALCAAFATLALEIPSNHDLFRMYPLCLLLEYALVFAQLAGVYFLSYRHGAASAVIVFLLFGLGLAEYFVILFKSMPISPGDLSALSTAMAVASTGFTYTLSAFCLYGLAAAALAMLGCQMASFLRPAPQTRSRRYLAINLLVGVLCLAGVVGHVTLIDYYHTLNIQIYAWKPLDSYYRQGFLPAFISGAQTINPPKPSGYSVETGEQTIKEHAAAFDKASAQDTNRLEAEKQFEQQKPTVITIMNETFSDLSAYQQMHAGYEGPTYFKGIPDAALRGDLFVSAYGGGTCNTEFEYLTGNSMANLGAGVYPYTIYNLTKTQNLVSQFNKLGYDTLAMHPNHPTNWNRENAYRDFGFDEFMSIDDFKDSERLRGMVTDKATYEKILERLRTNENPQFIFDVTMQNHSGYDTGLIPEDKQVKLNIDGVSHPEVDEYVSLIQESDRALQYFIDQLRQLDRPVVLVFFGDHQPYFPDTYNDQWFTGEDEATHQERLWQTDYIVWANYDIAGNTQTSEVDNLSINYLGATLMELIGAPLSDFQKAQLSLRSALPALNKTGFCDAEGTWHLANAATDKKSDASTALGKATNALSDYATMQYYNLFRDGKSIYTKNLQDAVNSTDPNEEVR